MPATPATILKCKKVITGVCKKLLTVLCKKLFTEHDVKKCLTFAMFPKA